MLFILDSLNTISSSPVDINLCWAPLETTSNLGGEFTSQLIAMADSLHHILESDFDIYESSDSYSQIEEVFMANIKDCATIIAKEAKINMTLDIPITGQTLKAGKLEEARLIIDAER